MDRNTLIGLLLIGVLLVGYSIFNKPSQEEVEEQKRQRDSIALVEKEREEELKKQQTAAATIRPDSLIEKMLDDSSRKAMQEQALGAFASAAEGKEDFFFLENELMKVTLTTKGGKVQSVQLKEFKSHDGKPLILAESDSNEFGLKFFSQNRMIYTGHLYFKPQNSSVSVKENESKAFIMRLDAGNGQYIDYIYSLSGNSYRLNFDIRFENMNQLIAANSNLLELDWKMQMQKHELSMEAERNTSTIFYKYPDDDVESLSLTSDDNDVLKTKVKWVAFKQQFFNAALVADNSFDKPTSIYTQTDETSIKNVRLMSSTFSVPYNHQPSETFGMSFFFAPNHFNTLKKADLDLEHLIPLGWGIFGWVNRFIVIKVFNFLDSFNFGYGLIILILTIVIKIVLLPLTYKSYIASAKMKVLKPEMDEITKEFEDPMKKQQAMMGLYKKAGVNPLGGCLPLLLQLPILIALFSFFPASFELRQESFLWAKDLSRYDSILDLGFNIPFYGDHVSLFTLLMTLSTILYTWYNMQMTVTTNPQMKWMMYIMPVIFLGVFNNYSAGLSYYYFLANVTSIGQQFLFKSFVDEDAIHRKIQEHKKKPQSQKKSKFQERLEKMAKDRGYKMPKR